MQRTQRWLYAYRYQLPSESIPLDAHISFGSFTTTALPSVSKVHSSGARSTCRWNIPVAKCLLMFGCRKKQSLTTAKTICSGFAASFHIHWVEYIVAIRHKFSFLSNFFHVVHQRSTMDSNSRAMRKIGFDCPTNKVSEKEEVGRGTASWKAEGRGNYSLADHRSAIVRKVIRRYGARNTRFENISKIVSQIGQSMTWWMFQIQGKASR